MSRSYNGFTPAERAVGGMIQERAFRSGVVPRPTKCSACGATNRIIAHLEDYARPLDAIIPLCNPCHYAVHARFTKPSSFDRRHALVLEIPEEIRGTGDLLGDIAAGVYAPKRDPAP